MTLVWTLVVPRVLGPAGFGVVTAALSVSGVLAIVLGLGTRNYLVREIVLHPDRGPKLIGTAMMLRVILSPIVAVAAVVFAVLAHYGTEQTIALYLAAAANIAILLTDPALAMFQASERMKYMALSDVINKSAQSLVGIAVALAGLGAIGITGNMAVVGVVVLILNVIWVRRYVRVDLHTSGQLIASMARQSFSFWATGVFFTIYLWIDTIMVSLMTNSSVVGWYGASTTLFQTLMFLPTLVATAWLPRLVQAYRGGRRQLALTAREPLELILVISAPMAAGTVMAAHALVLLLYGAAYSHAVPVMAILGLCLPPTYMNIMMSQVLIAEGRQVVLQWLMVAATIVNPAVNLVLIPVTQHRYHNGAIGAAVALLITEVLVAGGAFVMVRQVFNRASFTRCCLAVGASVAMLGASEAAAPLGTAVALAAGVAAFVALAVLLRIPTEGEVLFIRRLVARARPRMEMR
jgi:O-antigen/teichoic acid export membrane protein